MLSILALTAWTVAAAPAPQDAKAPAAKLVLQDEPGALDASTCRALLGEVAARRRLWIVLPGAPDAVDPLSAVEAEVTRVDVDVDTSSSQRGDERELAERARAAHEIVLSRGTYLGWRRFLGRRGATSRIGRVVEEAAHTGVVVCAQGAAAAYMAEWTVADYADVQRVPRNPRRADAPFVVRGLGLLPDTFVDASTRAGGAIDPLLWCVARTSIGRAVRLDGPVAWIVGGPAALPGASGAGHVLLFDLERARRMRDGLREGRVALIGAPSAAPSRADDAPITASDFASALRTLCEGDASSATITEGDLRVRLWVDEASDRAARDGIGMDVSWAPE